MEDGLRGLYGVSVQRNVVGAINIARESVPILRQRMEDVHAEHSRIKQDTATGKDVKVRNSCN